MKDVPIRLGICGAPGARKTEIASWFYDLSQTWFHDNDLVFVRTVDNVDKHFTEHLKRFVGVQGDHYVTMAYFHHRAALEDRIWATGDSLISCGTALDSLAHIQARMTLLDSMAESEVIDELKFREIAAANVLASYLLDARVPFHLAFYAPLPADVMEKGSEVGSFDVMVDAGLRSVMERSGTVMPTLLGETPRDQAQEILDALINVYPEIVADTEAERATA